MLNICKYTGLQSRIFGEGSKSLSIPEPYSNLSLSDIAKILSSDCELTHKEQHLLYVSLLRLIPKIKFNSHFPLQATAFYESNTGSLYSIASKFHKFPSQANSLPDFAINAFALQNGASDLLDYLDAIANNLPIITAAKSSQDDPELEALIERIFKSKIIRERSDWVRSKLRHLPQHTIDSIIKVLESYTVSPKANLMNTKKFLLDNIELRSQHDGSMLQSTIRALDKVIINSLTVEQMFGVYSLSSTELEELERTSHIDLKSKIQVLKETTTLTIPKLTKSPERSEFPNETRYKLALARWKAQNV